jgi:hypothetical protein
VLAQVPQTPPQPSGPQLLPVQLGAQTHCPLAPQVWPDTQLPQDPPQPLLPHTRPVQFGAQAH